MSIKSLQGRPTMIPLSQTATDLTPNACLKQSFEVTNTIITNHIQSMFTRNFYCKKNAEFTSASSYVHDKSLMVHWCSSNGKWVRSSGQNVRKFMAGTQETSPLLHTIASCAVLGIIIFVSRLRRQSAKNGNRLYTSDVKFHEIFWREIIHEIFREIFHELFQKFHDWLWVQAV